MKKGGGDQHAAALYDKLISTALIVIGVGIKYIAFKLT